MLTLQFCGGAGTVTGSCFLLQAAESKILVDCGMFQGGQALKRRNFLPFPFNPEEIDCLFLTHAHIDHSGLIPKLVKEGFRGKIYATRATADLCSIMLPDSGHIQEADAQWENRKARRAGKEDVSPLYTVEDARASLEYFHPVKYDEIITISPHLSFRLQNSGHILGSAMLELWATAQQGRRIKIVFTGDLGRKNQYIIPDPAVIEEADFLIMEATYGQRLHEEEGDREKNLAEVINSTIKRGGNVVIPSFAVGRTQELAYILNRLIDRREIPAIPVYIDSPLAIEATDIFMRHMDCFDLEMRAALIRGEFPLHFPEANFTSTVEESRAINEVSGALIISASGMCDAGRIRHHLKHNLWRPESTVLFVGYQAEGTLGRCLLEGASRVTLFGEEIAVRARIASIQGFSAHADREELLKWVGKFKRKPSQIILVHGETEALESMAALLREEYAADVYIPSYLEELSLLPMGRRLEPSEELSARLKAQQIIHMWQDCAATFSSQLLSYLEEETDLAALISLEERLGFIIRQMEQEAAALKTFPLLFAPSERDDTAEGERGVKGAEKAS